MAKRKRREFTDEFKNQIVQLYLNGKSKSELAKEYYWSCFKKSSDMTGYFGVWG